MTDGLSSSYVRSRDTNMGPPASRRRPESSREALGIRGRGGILRRNDLRRQVIRKKLLNSIGSHSQHRQPARPKQAHRR